MTQIEELLEEQIAFYRADAESYEAWFEGVFHGYPQRQVSTRKLNGHE